MGVIKYKDKEFPSILKLANYLKTADAAIARYYRTSESQEEFESKVDKLLLNKERYRLAIEGFNKKYHTNYTKTSQVYDYLQKNFNVKTSYITQKDGLTLQEFILLFLKYWDTPEQWVLTKDTPFTYNGQTYNTLTRLLAEHSTYVADFLKALLEEGATIDTVLGTVSKVNYHATRRPVINKVPYKSVSEMVRMLGLNVAVYRYYLREGYSYMDAYTATLEDQSLKDKYFPLETSVGTFQEPEDFSAYLGVPVNRLMRMITKDRVEHHIDLKKRGVDLTNYMDRDASEVFPIEYDNKILFNVNQFLNHFRLDGRKEVYYNGLFEDSEAVTKYIEKLEQEAVYIDKTKIYTLKGLREYMEGNYKVNHHTALNLWFSMQEGKTPQEKGELFKQNVDGAVEKTTWFTLDGVPYDTLLALSEAVNINLTTLKGYLETSTAKEEFRNKLKSFKPRKK